jgi:hypothetical protein
MHARTTQNTNMLAKSTYAINDLQVARMGRAARAAMRASRLVRMLALLRRAATFVEKWLSKRVRAVCRVHAYMLIYIHTCSRMCASIIYLSRYMYTHMCAHMYIYRNVHIHKYTHA